jgi:hypothetical protein
MTQERETSFLAACAAPRTNALRRLADLPGHAYCSTTPVWANSFLAAEIAENFFNG